MKMTSHKMFLDEALKPAGPALCVHPFLQGDVRFCACHLSANVVMKMTSTSSI